MSSSRPPCFCLTLPPLTPTPVQDVCLYFIEECLVALIPGSPGLMDRRVLPAHRESLLSLLNPDCRTALPGEAFGDGRCLRISYAESLETLGKAMDRMDAGIKALK